jgi:hypothetical protein
MEYFEDRPLLMLSQSANDLCLSLLVPEGDHEILLQELHRELMVEGQAAPGPSWQELQRWE